MRPYFGSWCEARARGQTYLVLLEPVVKTFPLVGEQSVSKSTYTICQNFFPTEIQESKDGSVTAVEPDKSEKGDCSDCLAQVQKIGSHDRRKRAYDAGYAKGFEEGKKLVDTNLKATNDALQNRIVEVLGETNIAATNQLIATQTAATLIVENQQLKNLLAARDKTITEQETELNSLHARSRLQVAARSGPQPILGPIPESDSKRPPGPYFHRRPPQCQ